MFEMQIPEKLIEILKIAKKVCVLTGAGISAESGIPTFRGGGNSVVWKGMPFDQISSARMIREDLDLVWEWFDYRRGLYKECQPNAAHFALAEWQNRFEDFTLITQNVDGLHERAGSKNILELHGNINHSKCENCGQIYKMNAEDVPHQPTIVKIAKQNFARMSFCSAKCLPIEAFQKAEEKSRKCDLFFIVGTSALVYPAAGLAEIAKFSGAKLVEVNPEETPMTDFCDFQSERKCGRSFTVFINMKTLYFDCFAGASGNMILAALVALGVDKNELIEQIKLLDISDFEIEFSTKDKSGISALHAEVKIPHEHAHRHLHHIEKIINDSRLDRKNQKTSS